MTRDELEAVIWKHAPFLASDEPWVVALAVDAVLTAADAYATEMSADAIRATGSRLRLTPPDEPRVHWAVGHDGAGCNRYGFRAAMPAVTTDTAAVTCVRCKRTTPYLEALGGGLEAVR